MTNRKTTFFYALLIAIASLAVGMVIASRLGMAPESGAQTVAAPPMNSSPITGPITSTTFRDIAKNVSPAVVNIRSTSKQRAQEMSEFFGSGGGNPGALGGGGSDDKAWCDAVTRVLSSTSALDRRDLRQVAKVTRYLWITPAK